MIAPTAWQLMVALAGVGSFMVLLVTFGVAYGKLTSRLSTLEKAQDGFLQKITELTVSIHTVQNGVHAISVDIGILKDRGSHKESER